MRGGMKMSVRDQIRERTRMSRFRLGQDAPEMVTIPSMPEIRCAQVPLNESEIQAGLIAAASIDVLDNQAGLQARDRAAMVSDIWYSLREPDNIDKKVFESVEEMVIQLDPNDIDFLQNSLMLLMSFASPAIDGLSNEDLVELKKLFGATEWSELTGTRWAAVKLCVSILLPEILQAKLSGIGSIDNSTVTSETPESTSTVEPNTKS